MAVTSIDEPIAELATRPFPLEGMCKVLVVIRLAIQDVLNHAIAAIPTPAQEIAFAERFQQRFGLVQPRRTDRREQDMDAR